MLCPSNHIIFLVNYFKINLITLAYHLTNIKLINLFNLKSIILIKVQTYQKKIVINFDLVDVNIIS